MAVGAALGVGADVVAAAAAYHDLHRGAFKATADHPDGIALDDEGRVYVTDIGAEALSLAGAGAAGAGALVGAGAASSGVITLTADTTLGGSGSLALSGAIGGAFGLTKTGAGTVPLSAYLDPTDRQNLLIQGNLVWEITTGGIDHKVLFGVEYGDQASANQRAGRCGRVAPGLGTVPTAPAAARRAKLTLGISGCSQPAASFFFAFFLWLGLYLQCHSASGAGSAGDLACDHGIDFGFGHSGHSCCHSAIGGYGYGGFRCAHSASD